MAGVYELRDGRPFATELASGPWDQNAQHGGAVAALLMRALEAVPTDGADLAIGRVTYEFQRPAPLGELTVSASIVRPGQRVQLLEGSVATPDGVTVAYARAQRVARAGVDAGPQPAELPPGPELGVPGEFPGAAPMFIDGAIEIRFVRGSFGELGPAITWFRLCVPIVAGEAPSPLQRLAAAADFPNGIGSELEWSRWLYINPDLSLFVEREPVGEWVCLDGSMRVTSGGIGLAEAVLFDTQGRVGRSVQTLYVAPRP